MAGPAEPAIRESSASSTVSASALHELSPHAVSAGEVADALGVDVESGLAVDEVASRAADFGPNRLPEAHRDGPVVRFLRQFNDVLIYVLLAAAVLTAFLREWADMVVILLVVLIDAIVGFVQEGKAEKALEGIAEMLSPTAAVLRDGTWSSVDAEELVPGDVVRLAAGDRVPADLRLVDATDMSAEESALTGESEPAQKSECQVAADAPLGDRVNMAYASTMVTAGRGLGVVVGTGADTEIGKISTMLAQVDTVETPLARQIAKFSGYLSIAVLVVSLAMIAVGYFAYSNPVDELLLAAVGFAVAAIPEGLPALITITLALGVQKMARRNAITRKLPAVQTLGSVNVICTDKTGTLTRNEMTVTQVVTSSGSYEVDGDGYCPDGEIRPLGPEALAPAADRALTGLGQAVGLANDTTLAAPESHDGAWSIVGEPTEGALAALAAKLSGGSGCGARLAPETGTDGSHPVRLATLPFSSDYKLMAVTAQIVDAAGAEQLVLVKGAPDRLLARSRTQLAADGSLEELDQMRWKAQIEELSGKGLRVLAAARRPAGAGDTEELTIDTLGAELTFLGLAGIVDPPRAEATDAVARCQDAGIVVKMITGDHAGTATAIAAQMGIDDRGTAVTGPELEAADEAEFARLAIENNVFARTSPEHKIRIVQALQDSGQVVAMTGDGVNDAPALRRADIGVAMGIKGTEVTKEAADLVLADDNFATIEQAVEHGRRIYDNLRKAIVFLLPTNGAQSLVILLAVLFGALLPLTPLQILWVNMVTAVTLAFAFAFEPAEDGIMERAPRGHDEVLIGARHILEIVVASVLIAGLSMGAFAVMVSRGYGIEYARTVATTVLVVTQTFYLFNVKTLEGSSLHRRVFTNNRAAWVVCGALIGLQLLFVYLPLMHGLFDTAPIGGVHLVYIVGLGVGTFIVIEIAKALIYRVGRTPPVRT